MEELGLIHQILIPFHGYTITINLEPVLMTWIVICLLIIFGCMTIRKRSMLPGPFQVIGEFVVSALYQLTEDAMDEELAKKYSPVICALFLFLVFSNWISLIPHMEEPTKDLNTPLSLGLMGFVLSHYEGIKAKGIKEYIKSYFEPMFFMMPLNLIGELAKVVSISFRLFGNIMGGSIIIMVISYLSYSLIIPPFLNLFFGIFVGTIQAFVFTMLTIVYISVQVK